MSSTLPVRSARCASSRAASVSSRWCLARSITRDAADFAGSIGAHFIIWPGIEGYNYPFQTPYGDSVGPEGLSEYLGIIRRSYPDASFDVTSIATM